MYDFYCIACADSALGSKHQVLAEVDFIVGTTVLRQGFEGLGAAFAGVGVLGGDDAACAGFNDCAFYCLFIFGSADVYRAPLIFFVGLTAGDDEVGSEAAHVEGGAGALIEGV